jgi:hypothetical protein
VKDVAFRTAPVTLSQTDTMTWKLDNQSVDYKVHSSTLTCTFKPTAFVTENSYLKTFVAPDVFAGVTDLAGAGPLQVDTSFSILNNAAYTRPVATFTTSRDYVDSQTGNRLLSLSTQWWMKTYAGTEGVLVSSGTAQFEPKDAEAWRVLWRVLAGFLASFSVALMVLVVRRSLYYFF